MFSLISGDFRLLLRLMNHRNPTLYLEHTTKPDARQKLFQHMKDLLVYVDKNLGPLCAMKMVASLPDV